LLRVFVLLAGLVQLFDLLVDRGGFLDFGRFSLRFFGFAQFGTPGLGFLAAVLGVGVSRGLGGVFVLPGRGFAAGTLARTGGCRRAFGHRSKSFYRFETTADCHGSTSSVPAVPPYNLRPGFRLRLSGAKSGALWR